MVERSSGLAGGGECHVETGIGLVGGKWKLLIVRLLLFRGSSRFNELAKELAGISNKVLTENLRELEDDGIVCRESAADNHRHYALSTAGSELLPILKQLGDWSERRATRDDRGPAKAASEHGPLSAQGEI